VLVIIEEAPQNRCLLLSSLSPSCHHLVVIVFFFIFLIYTERSPSPSASTRHKSYFRQATTVYVLAYQPGGYVVDGQNGRNISGPARCNDNFDMFNCYFGWKPIAHRMELFTKAPIQEGLYEALVNYNEPGKSSVC
jgi:hypothetical protein